MRGTTGFEAGRGVLSVAPGIAAWKSGLVGWAALLRAGAVSALFLWAPRSGRYVIRSEEGLTGLRRDERGEAIPGRAARVALVVVMLGLAMITLNDGPGGRDAAPTALLAWLLAFAALSFFASDAGLRRRKGRTGIA
jgi:hypothetical protein